MRLVTREVWHGWSPGAQRTGQNGNVRGGTVLTETIVADDEIEEIGEVEELLVEEVSIDGLCGVY
jgi:mycofactocin precursor